MPYMMVSLCYPNRVWQRTSDEPTSDEKSLIMNKKAKAFKYIKDQHCEYEINFNGGAIEWEGWKVI